jgi:hypothetical protein
MIPEDKEMVSVDIDIDDDELFHLMKLAHAKDITFNKLVESMLQEYIDNYTSP